MAGARACVSLVLAFIACAAPARAGTYDFAVIGRDLDPLMYPADRPVHVGSIDVVRSYAGGSIHWEGPSIVASSPGSHAADASAHLELRAPPGTSFVASNILVTYRGCAGDGSGWWIRSEIYGTGQWVPTTRHTVASGACVYVAGEAMAGAPVAPRIVSFDLGATRAASAQASGTSLAIHSIAGSLSDDVPPTASAAVAPAPANSIQQTVAWSAYDAESGPRRVTVRVTGAGTSLTSTAWVGASRNLACLTGQWVVGCGPRASGLAGFVVPQRSGTYAVDVVVEDGAGNVATASDTVAVTFVPELLVAPALVGQAQVGDILEAVPGQWSNAPAEVSYEFWRRDGVVLTRVAGPSADLRYVVGRGDAGAVLIARELVANDAGSAAADTAPSSVVLPAAPSGGVPSATGLPAIVDGQLVALAGTWDNGGAAGQPRVVAFRWETCRDGTCSDRGSGTSFTPGVADIGATIALSVDVANDGGAATARADLGEPVRAGSPTLESPPDVVGVPRVGDPLSASDGRWREHGAALTIERVWLVCPDVALAPCVERGGGTTFTPEDVDLGRRIRLRVRATSSAGSPIATSDASAPVLGRGECIETAPGSITVCIAGARVTVTAYGPLGRLTSGRPARVRGKVQVSGTLALPRTVQVRFRPTADLARYASATVVRVGPSGTFSATITPRISGRLEVAATVAGRSEAIVLDAGPVRVRPVISARFSARRDLAGRLRDLRVAGHVRPALRVRGLRLLMEARLGDGRIVGLICRLAEQPLVHGGSFRASCASRGLPADVRYRLTYAPGPGSPLERASTRWARARIRH